MSEIRITNYFSKEPATFDEIRAWARSIDWDPPPKRNWGSGLLAAGWKLIQERIARERTP
jgi:hypothetical protein